MGNDKTEEMKPAPSQETTGAPSTYILRFRSFFSIAETVVYNIFSIFGGFKPVLEETTSGIPKPYSLLFHPYLTTAEKIICKVFDLLFKPLVETEVGSKHSKDILSKFRKRMSDSEHGVIGRYALKKWSEAASSPSSSPCTLAESSGFIPFRKNILKEWNIIDDHTVLQDVVTSANDREGVRILVRFPSSLLPAELRENATTLDYSGCLDVGFDKIDWKKFAHNVPMLVQFHGGGMTLGGIHDSMLIEETARLVQNAPTSSPPDLITISVDYGLAPEHPFPIGVMDALSVIDYLLNDDCSRESIHLTGMSAGANICLVAGLEGVRRFPGRISSIQAQCPMVDPAGDSLSYYMNQAVLPSISFLRWSWRAYLGLQKPKETPIDNNDDDESELEKVLRKDSNYSSWNAWKAHHSSKALHRLVNPALDIPEGLNGDKVKSAPKVIVRYNIGDPLQDDAKLVVEALKPKTGGNASFYEEMHLHCNIAGPYDASAPQEYWKVWSEAVFGDDCNDPKN